MRAVEAELTGTALVPAKDGAPPPRRHFVTLGNLFEHIGRVSSLRNTRLSRTPECGVALSPFMWNMERFATQTCGDLGVVPCVIR